MPTRNEDQVLDQEQNAAPQEDAQDTTGTNDDGKQETFSRDYVEKLRKSEAKFRTRLNELEAAQKAAEDAKKSELQLAQEKITELESAISEAKVQEMRARVAQETGVPVDMLPSDRDEDDLREYATKLMEWAGQQAKSPGLPKVESVGKTNGGGYSRDDLARAILGVQPVSKI